MEFPWHILPDIFGPIGLWMLILLSPLIIGTLIGGVWGVIVGLIKRILGIKGDDD